MLFGHSSDPSVWQILGETGFWIQGFAFGAESAWSRFPGLRDRGLKVFRLIVSALEVQRYRVDGKEYIVCKDKEPTNHGFWNPQRFRILELILWFTLLRSRRVLVSEKGSRELAGSSVRDPGIMGSVLGAACV